ncbi:MAG: 5-formyltetrahydrofolate cyclo-ligase, partial [Pseudomonadota bacterium]
QAQARGGVSQATFHLVRLLGDRPPGTLSAYWPMRSELDPRPALQALHARGWSLCLPVVVGKGQALQFRAWHPGADLVAGAYGAMIPAQDRACVPDVVLAPLLAFDAQGYRLGYGGGFYDRTLEALRDQGQVRAYGLAYSAQLVGAVPREATDQPLDGVITELGLVAT